MRGLPFGNEEVVTHMKLTLTLLAAGFAATLAANSFDELTVLGRNAFARGDYRTAREHFQLAERAAASEPAERAAIAAANLATVDYTQGRAAAAVDGYRKALRYWGEQGESGPRLRSTLRHMADALHQRGEYAEARHVLDRLENIVARDAKPDVNTLARLRLSMARTETAMGQVAKAESLYRQALAGSPGDPSIRAAALDGLGETCLVRGKSEDAETAFLEAISLWMSLDQEVRAASTANRLGSRWLTVRKPRRALPYLTQALKVFEEKGITGEQLLSTLNNLGQAYRFAGDAKNAIRFYERAIETAQRDLGPPSCVRRRDRAQSR